MTLAAPEHQEMNGQVEVTWRTLHTIAHSIMVHARVLEAYISFLLMYTTDHIFPVLLIKYLINYYGDPNTPFKLATCTKSSVSHLRVSFCQCVVRKATAHVGTKTLNMRHQAQKGFRDTFVGTPQHQKGYLVYLPIISKIISSYDVFIDEIFSSVLTYMPRPYSEAMAMRPSLMYTPCATYSRRKTGNIITFAQFEEGNLPSETNSPSETRNDAEISD